MKLINTKLAAAAVIIGSASSLMAGSYQFQFVTTTPGFTTATSTYIWVTTALDTPVSAGVITKFSIQTPKGLWTSGQFAPNTPTPPGSTTGKPSWSFGRVEVTGGGNTLLFTVDAQLQSLISSASVSSTSGVISPQWDVDLTSTSISDSFNNVGAQLQDFSLIANGNWVNVHPVPTTNAPDATGTLALMLGAFGLLGVYQYVQSRSVASQA